MIDFSLIIKHLPDFLQGAYWTIIIAVSSATLGFILGNILAFTQVYSKKLAYIVKMYVLIIRGTPMLLHILFIFYILPQLGIELNAICSVIVAIGINSSAYVSQIIRGSIKTINPGEIAAAKTLGFTFWQTQRQIVFPQALSFSLPSLCNEFITLVKDSSLASVIGVVELTKQASIIRSRTYDTFSSLLAVAIIYLLLTGLLTILFTKLERNKNHDCS